MIDTLTFIRERLILQTSVTDVLRGERVYRVRLPGGDNVFDPANGAGLVISGAAGHSHPEIDGYTLPRFQLRAWALTGAEAMAAYIAAYDVLHGKRWETEAGTALSCLEEVQPQNITDRDSGWETVLSFFNVQIVAAVTSPIIVDAEGNAIEFGGYL